MLDDVRYAVRGMARTPGFTAIAVLMIALGTGANAAMFSIIDAVMLGSPFREPERIALVRVAAAGGTGTAAVPLAHYRALMESPGAFEAIGMAGSGGRPILRGLGEPRGLNVECVSAEMFKVLGTAPLAGRSFTEDEDKPGGPSVVVLSYQFWQRELGGAPDAIGRVTTLNGVPTTVVGIMPRAFGGPYSRNNNDGWLPVGPAIGGQSAAGCTVRSTVSLFVRVKPGAALNAVAEHATLAAGIAHIPDGQGRTGARLVLMPIGELWLPDLRAPLLALLGSVGLVLLIACANVANLQLERVFGRRRELAVRMAIGATRARVVRQTLIENLLLYAFGCLAGLFAAHSTLDLIVGLMPRYIPQLNAIAINGRILAATAAVAALAGLAVGAVPALQGPRAGLMDDLRVSSRSATRGGAWTRRVLVSGQIALSLTLLVGAALMLRTFFTLRPSDPGFIWDDKLTATVRLRAPASAPPAARALFANLLDRVRTIPGVTGVSGSTYLPMSGNIGIASVTIDGRKADVWSGAVTANYFSEMAIPIVRGRAFDDRDRAGAVPVAVVNEAMVRKFWPGADPLGSVLEITSVDGRMEARQIIGVLRDTRSDAGDTRLRPELYTPYEQTPIAYLHVIIRASNPSDPRLRTAFHAALSAVDSAQFVDRFALFEEVIGARLATWRFGAWLLGIFAGMAVLLAAVGLASSIAWWVAQRTREIGVRMALGARPAQVTRMFLRQGLALAAVGLVLGIAGAAASTRFLESWLYGVTPLNPAAFAGSAAALLAIAALASYIPARRAARVDPLVALRAE